jgi:hypothetical protein
MPRYRKKPLAQLVHGTRIYAPVHRETRYRVVGTDPVSGERIFVKCRTEELARGKARELEQFIAQAAPIRDPQDAGCLEGDELAPAQPGARSSTPIASASGPAGRPTPSTTRAGVVCPLPREPLVSAATTTRRGPRPAPPRPGRRSR